MNPIPPANPTPAGANNHQDPPFSQSFQSPPIHDTQAGSALSPQNSHQQSVWHAVAIMAGILLAMALLVGIALLVNHIAANNTANQLQPTAAGLGQCDAGANYAQIAIASGADCTTAKSVIKDASKANGANYTSNGYTCKATQQGSNTQWSDYWNGTFYSYSCANGSKQVAFNWQSLSATSPPLPTAPAPTTPAPTTPTVTVGGPGALQPTPVGGTQCNVSNNYAQVAIGGGADCTTAESVIQSANGSDYSADGYTCKATKEGSGTQWSDYWNNDFYAYTCANGSKQVAFNWQSPSAAVTQ
jgi:hypothetical protein